MFRKILFCFFHIFFFDSLQLNAQGNQHNFLPLSNKLSNPTVKSIIMDSKGFMWFGTENGLNKYDGINLTVYEANPNDSTSLFHNTINVVFEDRNQQLWIGTSEGLCKYNRESDNFIRIINKNIFTTDINNSFITSVTDDIFGNIWIGTIGNGLICYNYNNEMFSYYRYAKYDVNTINSNNINYVTSDTNGNIWIATWNGLDMFNPLNKNFSHFLNSSGKKGSISCNIVSCLLVDKTNKLWVGTFGGGLNLLDINSKTDNFKNFRNSTTENSISSNYIYSLTKDSLENIWIGTENGLNYLDRKSGLFYCYTYKEGQRNSIGGNFIRSVYIDNTDILWIGANRKGIFLYDKRYEKFETFQRNILEKTTLGSNDVTGFTEDKYGKIWISTDGGGICIFNPHTKKFEKLIQNTGSKKFLENNAIAAIACDFKNNIWAGIWNGGIDVLDNNGKRLKNYKIEKAGGAGNNKVYRLFIDKFNNVWVCTAGSGLFILDRNADKFIPFFEHYNLNFITNSNYVSSILFDSEGYLWITSFNGVFKFKKTANTYAFITSYLTGEPNSISSNRVTDIIEDSKKRIWLSTDDKGLNLFNKQTQTFTSYQKEDGLPGNTIKGIVEGPKGCLWITTNKGLSMFDPSNETFRNYTVEDGLNSDNFYFGMAFLANNGEFYAGGNNGFNIFKPEAISDNPVIPRIHFTDFKIFNHSVKIGAEDSPLKQHISETKEIILNHKQTSFTIEFAALNYTRPSENQYKYKLNGFDKNWINAGHNHSANYTNMDAGTYTFYVKGSNNDGLWNNEPISLKIKVLPPFWKTIWAYCLYVLSFGFLSFLFIRLHVLRAKQSHLIKLDQLKLQFFSNISHELRTPLSLILSPIENLLATDKFDGDTDKKLKLVYRNADILFRLVNELMDFTKSEEKKLQLFVRKGNIVKFVNSVMSLFTYEAQQRNIQFTIEATEENTEMWFDADKMEKILINLISNAFKFTPEGGTITLHIENNDNSGSLKKSARFKKIFQDGCILISVTDNGIGIAPDQIEHIFDRFYMGTDNLNQKGTGIGLALTRKLVEAHRGIIDVESLQNIRTSFHIAFPKGNSQFKTSELAAGPAEVNTIRTNPDFLINRHKENPLETNKKKYTVLVVEDNNDLREYIASTLSAVYNVKEATDGESGFDAACEFMPDLIISDVMMSCMSGIELCRNIKNDMETSHIPVILLTARSSTENKVEGIESGADAYITKPFNISLLQATIKQLIETRQKLFHRFSQDVYIMPREICKNTNDQQFLEKIIEYIDEHLTDEVLSVEKLAGHLLMSRGNVWRKIKMLTGQSVAEFIRTIRLKKAIQLIESGKYNVSEIAYKVGFTSPAYFIKCFRTQFGKTPSEYFIKK